MAPYNNYKKSNRKYYKPRQYRSKKSYFKKAMRNYSETKIRDYDITTVFGTVTCGTTQSWAGQKITDIDQGTEISERIARKIQVVGLYVEGILESGYAAVAGDPYNQVRINISRFNNTQHWTTNPLTDLGVDAKSGILRKTNTQEFIKQYMDRMIVLQPTYWHAGNSVAGPCFKKVKYYKAFKNPITINYTGMGGSDSDTDLWMHMWTDSSVIASPGFISGRISLYYKDL